MSPILSKLPPPPPRNTKEVVDLAAKKARPILESLLELVHASLVGGNLLLVEVSECLGRLGSLADRLVKSSVQMLESYCCLDLRRYTRGPEPKLQSSVPILFVIMLLMMLYNAFVVAYMPAAGIAFNSPTSLLFHALIFLVLSSFVQAARTDPGGIPNSKEWRNRGCPPLLARERKHCSDEPRWCRKSEAYKPDRAHYCRVLGRGVLRMDHHCPWLGNTVGFANHKFFILFLLYSSTACGMLGLSIIQLLVQATLPALTTFLLIGAEGLAALLSGILVPFFLFHAWLLVRNMTTIEFCEMMREGQGCGKDGDAAQESRGSMYDLGLYQNISCVMGGNPLLWLAPVGGPLGDGVRFPTKDTPLVEVAETGPTAGVNFTGIGDQQSQHTEGDPEAAHPSGGSQEQGLCSGEDSAGGSSCVTTKEAAGDAASFLVWHSAAEFTEDLRLGCEVMEDTFGKTVLRLATLCALGPLKAPKRSSGGGPPAVRRSSARIALVKRTGGGSTSSRAASESEDGFSRSSAVEFLSGLSDP